MESHQNNSDPIDCETPDVLTAVLEPIDRHTLSASLPSDKTQRRKEIRDVAISHHERVEAVLIFQALKALRTDSYVQHHTSNEFNTRDSNITDASINNAIGFESYRDEPGLRVEPSKDEQDLLDNIGSASSRSHYVPYEVDSEDHNLTILERYVTEIEANASRRRQSLKMLNLLPAYEVSPGNASIPIRPNGRNTNADGIGRKSQDNRPSASSRRESSDLGSKRSLPATNMDDSRSSKRSAYYDSHRDPRIPRR